MLIVLGIFDTSMIFYFIFQMALNIDAIKNDTNSTYRRAYLFWEHPLQDEKCDRLINSLSNRGEFEAKFKLKCQLWKKIEKIKR